MSGKLEGRVAVVTGGNSGIGLATAKRFVAEGAYVFITGRRQVELDRTVEEIGPRAVGIRAYLSNLADLDGLYDRVKIEKGRIDVLFANAGGGSMLPLGRIIEEQDRDTFGRNVKGVLFTVQKALPLLVDGASVILTGSTAAAGGTPAFSVYAASKAAVRAFARNWILDLKERRIRVNAIGPAPRGPPVWSIWRARTPRSSRVCWITWRGRSRSAASVIPTRLQGPLSSWLRTMRASSPAPSCSSMAARPRSEAHILRCYWVGRRDPGGIRARADPCTGTGRGGRAHAKANGKSLGRPFKMTPSQRREAIKRRDLGRGIAA